MHLIAGYPESLGSGLSASESGPSEICNQFFDTTARIHFRGSQKKIGGFQKLKDRDNLFTEIDNHQ